MIRPNTEFHQQHNSHHQMNLHKHHNNLVLYQLRMHCHLLYLGSKSSHNMKNHPNMYLLGKILLRILHQYHHHHHRLYHQSCHRYHQGSYIQRNPNRMCSLVLHSQYQNHPMLYHSTQIRMQTNQIHNHHMMQYHLLYHQ